jgi:DNA primase
MARYTQDSIERLRESVDVVDLIGTRTDLRRVGSRWVGLCPFHEERTPSFSVNGEQGLYHCFGCGEGGDAISFVRETEQLDFTEAVEMLAERYNVELKREREDPQEEERRRRRERLLALLERATSFYEKYLWESAEAAQAREYLRGRGLSEEVLRTFRVGWSPKGWDKLVAGAERDGYTLDELVAAGLAQRKKSGSGGVDRFRERIMFPLADSRGRVLGFGARAMRDDQGAKYINTSENDVYHKGRQLFGIDKARSAAAKTRRLVVVEGYTDVLALHQSGLAETVAIMGTALTEQQLAELARAAGAEGTIYLALDADRSGQQAMLRAAKIAEDRDVELRVVQLPEGSDPAELVAEGGAEAIVGRLDGALSVLEFSVRRVLAEGKLGTPEGRDRALGQARDLIAAAPDQSAKRDHLVHLVADWLNVSPDYVLAGVGSRPRPVARPVAAAARDDRFGDPGPEWGGPPDNAGGVSVSRTAHADPALESERIFLADCLRAGEKGRQQLEQLTAEHLSSTLMQRARDHLLAHFADPLAGLDPADQELSALVTGIASRADQDEDAEAPVLRMSFLALELKRFDREIRRARADGNHERQGKLAVERQRVRTEMDAVMGEVG